MCIRNATGAFLILLASSLPSLGQVRPAPNRAVYGIAGTVRDDDDQRTMESVRVDLKQASGTPINSTFTRDRGEFEFFGIPSGDYVLEIKAQNYEPYRETVSIDNSSRRGLAVFLHRPMIVVSTNTSGTISAHELSIPHKAHDEYEKGLSLIRSKSDYKSAIVQFERAIKDFPNFYEAYAQVGSAYTFLGEMGPAEEAMRKSIAVSSNQYSEAFFLLAGLLNNTRRFTEAETISRQGVAIEASSWRGHFEVARALWGLKRPEDAEKSAIKARDLKPDDPAVYLVLANIHIQLRDYPSLLKDLDTYLKLSPNGPEADQARKTKEQLQEAMESSQDGSPSKTSDRADSNAPNQVEADAQDEPKSDESDPPQSNEREQPSLPRLPPPEPEP